MASHDSRGHTHHSWSQMVTVLRPRSQRKSSICRFSRDRTFGGGDLGLIRPHSRETQFTEQPPSLTLLRETSLFFLAEVSCGAFFSERALRQSTNYVSFCSATSHIGCATQPKYPSPWWSQESAPPVSQPAIITPTHHPPFDFSPRPTLLSLALLLSFLT